MAAFWMLVFFLTATHLSAAETGNSTHSARSELSERHGQILQRLFPVLELPFDYPPETKTVKIPRNLSLCPPVPVNSGTIVSSHRITSAPVLDGIQDSCFNRPVSIDNPFFENTLIASCYDSESVYFLIRFENRISTEVFLLNLEWDRDKKSYSASDYEEADYKYYLPRKNLFLDLFWETGPGLEKSLGSRKKCLLDLWEWAPGTCSGFLDDRSVRIQFSVSPGELRFHHGELLGPLPFFLNPSFLVFGLEDSDIGIPPYTAIDTIPSEFKGEKLNWFRDQLPSGSAGDLRAVWAFNGKQGDLSGAAAASGVGKWSLEISRKLRTGHSDDVQFEPGKKSSYRFYFQYMIPVYSKDLKGRQIYDPLLERNLGKFFPYYTLKFVD
ncbi:MAG: hypothetical protein PHW04_01265 [Candidatus Wallbacteria bacterium]|nr:hypothetical protein [Candidatus Wallbacteria bacterium]